jgi:hypothetical protein
MKTFTAILILIANLWHQAPPQTQSGKSLRALYDLVDEFGGGVTTQQDPPDDGGNTIIQPPPR